MDSELLFRSRAVQLIQGWVKNTAGMNPLSTGSTETTEPEPDQKKYHSELWLDWLRYLCSKEELAQHHSEHKDDEGGVYVGGGEDLVAGSDLRNVTVKLS